MLANHFAEFHYGSGFQYVDYVKTFQQLKDQYDSRPEAQRSDESAPGHDGCVYNYTDPYPSELKWETPFSF